MLKIEGLSIFYDEIQAVSNASLEIQPGEIVTLIGANGAGKTSILRAISGIIRPSAGSIEFNEISITKLSPDLIVRLGIVHVPEGRHIFANSTVESNLRIGAYTVKNAQLRAKTLSHIYELFPRLKERRRQQGGTLSGGEQQMLALGRALMSQPRLLILDEPSLGIAPLIVEEIAKTIRLLRDLGITILLVEQNAHMALSLANRGYVIENGRTVASGPAEELLNSPKILAHYLGGEVGAD
jgi:branched-chain amino acid transport system ATP-binding protein